MRRLSPLAAGDREDPKGSGPATLSRRAFLAASLVQVAALLGACSPVRAPVPAPTAGSGPAAAPTSTGMPTPLPTAFAASTTGAPPPGAAQATGIACALRPVVAPTALPYPGYTAQEPETGLHVTGQAQPVDFNAYRLRVSGKVDRPVDMTYDDVRCLPKVSAACTLECPGFFVDHTNLAGAALAAVIAAASPQRDATYVKLVSVEGYSQSFTLDEALAPENFLAYEWEGQPLPPSHGFPLRAAMPGRPGSSWVKWVVGIEIS
jgi:DMSO/TMAO reductase YedYZ molybdopterin-dependent catalytic subunit